MIPTAGGVGVCRDHHRSCGAVPVAIRVAGGYRLISVVQLCMAWWAFREALIRFQDLRAYFAAHEAVARRCGIQEGREPEYGLEEVRRLLGARNTASARGSLHRLERVGLLRWGRTEVTFAGSPDELHVEDLAGFWSMLSMVENRRRRVPVPRRTLRFLAGGARRAVCATVLGHLLRCVYIRAGACTSRGRCKAAWIAETFGVSLRRVRDARTHLGAIGWLKVGEVPQWLLNRYGASVTVNPSWEQCGASTATGMAPPPADFATGLAPPDSHQEPPTERSENQEPARLGGPAPGFSSPQLPRPDLRHVVLEDLKCTDRTLALFGQASERGLVDGGDAARLAFVGAAEHALAIGSRNPCGLFAWLVRNRRYAFVTQADEDAAQRRIKALLYGHPPGGKARPHRGFAAALSDGAKLVRAVRAALFRRGVLEDPFPHVQRARPWWTRAMWDEATRELKDAERACLGGDDV